MKALSHGLPPQRAIDIDFMFRISTRVLALLPPHLYRR
jgi:hypothetical protein